MALRQTTGFVGSLLRLIGPDWTVPDYSTLSRRQKTLVVTIPYRGSHGPLNLLIDSTGIKAEGEGEWHTRKHGGSKRRARHCCSDRVWMAPAGQGLCSGLAFGRSRPCIRRLSCGIRAAARPDEVRRRSGPNQWHALLCAPVRTGCPDCRVAVRLPSPHVVPEARLRRDAPHHLGAGRERPACPVRPGWPGSSRRFGSAPRQPAPCGSPARRRRPSRAFSPACAKASPYLAFRIAWH